MGNLRNSAGNIDATENINTIDVDALTSEQEDHLKIISNEAIEEADKANSPEEGITTIEKTITEGKEIAADEVAEATTSETINFSARDFSSFESFEDLEQKAHNEVVQSVANTLESREELYDKETKLELIERGENATIDNIRKGKLNPKETYIMLQKAEGLRKAIEPEVEMTRRHKKAKEKIKELIQEEYNTQKHEQARMKFKESYASEAEEQIKKWRGTTIKNKNGEERLMDNNDIQTTIERYENSIFQRVKLGHISEIEAQQELDQASVLRDNADLSPRKQRRKERKIMEVVPSQEDLQDSGNNSKEVVKGNEIISYGLGDDYVVLNDIDVHPEEDLSNYSDKEGLKRLIKKWRDDDPSLLSTDEDFTGQKAQLREVKRLLVGRIGVDNLKDFLLLIKDEYDKNPHAITNKDFWKDRLNKGNLDDIELKRSYWFKGKGARKIADFATMYVDAKTVGNSGSYLNRLLLYLDGYVVGGSHNTQNKVSEHTYDENKTSEKQENKNERQQSGSFIQGVRTTIEKVQDFDVDELIKGVDTKTGSDQVFAFVKLLADYDQDGYVDYNDKGQWMGNSVKEFYKTAMNRIVNRHKDISPEKANEKLVNNLLSVMSVVVKSDPSFDDDAFIKNLEDGDLSAVLESMQNKKEYLDILQNVIKNSAIQPDHIFVYGTEAVTKFEEDKRIAKELDDTLRHKEFTKQEVDAIDNKVDQHLTSLQKEGMTSMEAENLRPVLTTAMQNFVTREGFHGGLAAGMRLELINNLHLNMALGVRGPDKIAPIVGVSISYDTNLFNNETRENHLKVGATGMGFIPYASESITKKFTINPKTQQLDMDSVPQSVKTIDVGVHGTAVLLGGIPTYTVGLHTGLSRDKMAGIEKNEQAIRESLGAISKNLIDTVFDQPKDASYDEKLSAVKELLSENEHMSSFDESGIDRAAQTMLSGLAYFGDLHGDGKENEREAAATMLTNFYTTQWRNVQVEKLQGLGFKGVDVGVDRIVGTTIFIPSMSLSFEDYARTANYRETKESLARLKRAEDEGEGNLLYTPDYENNKFESGSDSPLLNSQIVDDVNKRFKQFNPNIPQDMDIETVGDGKFLKIPADLFKKYAINIKIADDKKHLIYRDDNDDLYAPLGMSYRLFDGIHTNSKSLVLNVGTTNSSKSTTLVGNYAWDNFEDNGYDDLDEFYEKAGEEVEKNRVSSVSIEDALTSIRAQAQNNDNLSVFSEALGEIEVRGYDPKNKEFTYSNGKETRSVSFDNDIQIKLNDDNTISFESKGSQKGDYPQFLYDFVEKTQISLDDAKEFGFGLNFEEKITNSLRELNNLEREGDSEDYKSMMAALVSNDGKAINIDVAYDSLVALVGSSNKNNITDIRQIIDTIESSHDKTQKDAQKAYIVHKMAVVMAESPYYSGKTIGALLSGRQNLYNNMLQDSGLNSELGAFNYERFESNVYNKEAHNEKFDLNKKSKSHNNIVGIASFYRNDKNGAQEANGFALAPLGDVSVYGNMITQVDGEQDRANIIAGVVKKLSQSDSYKTQISGQIAKYLNQLTDWELDSIPNNKLSALLSGETVDIAGNPLALDLEAVAYGQAECGGNSGFGIRIKKIKTLGKEGVIETDGTLTETVSQTGLVGADMFYYNGFGNRSEGWKESNEFSIGLAAIVGKEEEPKETEINDGDVTTNPGGGGEDTNQEGGDSGSETGGGGEDGGNNDTPGG